MIIETTVFGNYEIKISTPDGEEIPTMLMINNQMTHFNYLGENGYESHLFYRTFKTLEDLAIAYVQANPNLEIIHVTHH